MQVAKIHLLEVKSLVSVESPHTGRICRKFKLDNRDDTTCLIHDFYRVARPVGGGTPRRGHYARGIVASLDPTAPCPHRGFAGEELSCGHVFDQSTGGGRNA